jgi:hypothetical protein
MDYRKWSRPVRWLALGLLVLLAGSQGAAWAAPAPPTSAPVDIPGSDAPFRPPSTGSGQAAPAAAPAAPSTGCTPAWSLVTGPEKFEGPYLEAVAAPGANDVWAVGGLPAGEQTFGWIIHWDGQGWRQVASPRPTPYNLIGVAAAAPNDVWAVGYTLETVERPAIVHWNGVAWSWVPVSLAPGWAHLYRVAVRAADDAWAVGAYNTGSGRTPLIMHWNGQQWSTAFSGGPGASSGELFDVSAVAANDAWAVTPGTILHWDGQQWTPQLVPYTLRGVTALAANNAWAVGSQPDGSPALVHWDGTAWTLVPGPRQGAGYNELWNVRFTGPNDGWATGYYQDAVAGGEGPLLLHWDGTAWTLSAGPAVSGKRTRLYGLAVRGPSDVWTVGWVNGGSPGALIEHFAAPCTRRAQP